MTKNKAKLWILISRDSQVFQKIISHLKILVARRVAPSKLLTEEPQIKDAVNKI
jgi:hypothetical protein